MGWCLYLCMSIPQSLKNYSTDWQKSSNLCVFVNVFYSFVVRYCIVLYIYLTLSFQFHYAYLVSFSSKGTLIAKVHQSNKPDKPMFISTGWLIGYLPLLAALP